MLEQECELYETCLVIPVNRLPLRGARYEVCLREAPLRAVHAMHTILSRMVVFHCSWCRERFPAFHPAFMPPAWLEKKMEILKKGHDGVAVCNVAVASWEEPPPFPSREGEEDLIAHLCRGVCLRCQRDIDRQVALRETGCAVAPVWPKWSHLNEMDPNYQFPPEFLELFQMATTIEAMLVSLEHMQVHYVTVGRSGLSKFRRNVISFPAGRGRLRQAPAAPGELQGRRSSELVARPGRGSQAAHEARQRGRGAGEAALRRG